MKRIIAIVLFLILLAVCIPLSAIIIGTLISVIKPFTFCVVSLILVCLLSIAFVLLAMFCEK